MAGHSSILTAFKRSILPGDQSHMTCGVIWKGFMTAANELIMENNVLPKCVLLKEMAELASR
jgi:hypothetical protein